MSLRQVRKIKFKKWLAYKQMLTLLTVKCVKTCWSLKFKSKITTSIVAGDTWGLLAVSVPAAWTRCLARSSRNDYDANGPGFTSIAFASRSGRSEAGTDVLCRCFRHCCRSVILFVVVTSSTTFNFCVFLNFLIVLDSACDFDSAHFPCAPSHGQCDQC